MQYGFYFNQQRCIGCYTCAVSCKDWYDIPAGEENWLRLKKIEKGKYPHPYVGFLFIPCYQCESPVCMAVCPTQAISKRESDGIVMVDSNLCLGGETCNYKCYKACPYKAPQYGKEPNAKMRKCEMCSSRMDEGKAPICVEACPMFALDYGLLEDLKAKYGDIQKAEGFSYSNRTRPAFICKPRLDKSD